MTKHIALLSIGMLALSLAASADDGSVGKLPPASDKKGVTYEKDIKAIFDNSCVKCHSGEKAKAKLHMDTLEGVLKGAKKDKVVEPGNSAGSILVKAIAHVSPDEDDWMPPLNNKAKIGPLTAEEIGLIRAWIDQGAK
jgi:hypothetical protein